MNLSEIKSKLHSSKYDFLRSDPNLGENIILLGLGGSHAYGMNNENSDLDVRGIATNSLHNMLIGNDFEEVVNVETDTTVYSFDKMIKLLCSCNPNTIEILGLKPEHYLYLTPVGQALIDNRSMFLSKRAVSSGATRQFFTIPLSVTIRTVVRLLFNKTSESSPNELIIWGSR